MRRLLFLSRAIAGLAWALAATQAGAAGASLFAIRDAWLDEDGRPALLSQWESRPTVVAMEYSACRFTCSIYWRRLVQVQAEADRLGLALEFVILSIDPEHDTPAAWRAYREARDLHRANWHFLTGSRSMTTRAATLLGVHWWYDEDHLMHDFRIVRLDAHGVPGAAVSNYDESVAPLLRRP